MELQKNTRGPKDPLRESIFEKKMAFAADYAK